MKKLRLFLMIFFTLLVIAFPTDTPSQTHESRVTTDSTALYTGPGNEGYATLSQLAKGTPVIPVASYGDFIKVKVTTGGKAQEGFVVGTLLENIPPNLPQLNQDQVPWTEMINVAALPVWNTWSTWIEDGKLKHDNTALVYNHYLTLVYDYEPINIPDSFEVDIQFTGQGQEYGILLFGRLNKQGEWWNGIRQLDARVYAERLSLLFRDGTKEYGESFDLPQSLEGKRITLRFKEKGSELTVIGPDGKAVKQKPLRLSVVTPTDSQTQSPPLRELAHKRGIQIGAMMFLESLRTTNIFTKEFNRLVSEDFHWSMIRPSNEPNGLG